MNGLLRKESKTEIKQNQLIDLYKEKILESDYPYLPISNFDEDVPPKHKGYYYWFIYCGSMVYVHADPLSMTYYLLMNIQWDHFSWIHDGAKIRKKFDYWFKPLLLDIDIYGVQREVK